MTFDRPLFFSAYKTEVGALKQSQVDGLEALLAAMEADPLLTDLRHGAYMLATVRHECAGTYAPIEEYGHGKGHPYGKPVNGKVYYGRGYVQLTWDYNYKKIGAAIGLGTQLLENPALALKPEVAYGIMSYGMRTGTFTGKKLADYIAAAHCDYTSARKIINGLDKAQQIAGYAQAFERILKAALKPSVQIPDVTETPLRQGDEPFGGEGVVRTVP